MLTGDVKKKQGAGAKSVMECMKKIISIALLATIMQILTGIAFATDIDQYPGDTSIYGVTTATIQPNVLIILDNSGSMSGTIITGDPYDPGTTYTITNDCNALRCSSTYRSRWAIRSSPMPASPS